ncbi:MAG: hypothetical protein UR81_C0024G0007 [Candidatus Levybacteria bacterium GW2011_GWB1_35_5]|nr:MAG: hypothetical protein UR81_C0024G0007 [Candidatus Levybacteria bacterium GW2011_GWB1_35_5]
MNVERIRHRMARLTVASTIPEALNSLDRPFLVGKTAIVTGGSRDVGRGIVEALAKQGVRVIFSYNNKPRRANEVLANVEQMGGSAYAIGGDTSTPEGRDAFFASVNEILKGEKVDILVLSASGKTPEHNQDTSKDLLDKFLPQINEGGTVIQVQSVPSHFLEPLRGSFSLGDYNNVAINKNANLRLLRGRIPEMEEHGVKFLVVCPPIVSGTNNVDFANRRDPTAEPKHNLVTDRLGLPRHVTKEIVGEKVVQLLLNPDIKSGHMEFFNDVEDMLTPLEEIYGTSAIYVNTLKRLQEIDDQTRGIGVGRAIISLGDYEGRVRIKPEHAKGHFVEKSGLPQILPGHKQIRAAVDAIGMIERKLGKHKGKVRLAGFESADFLSVVVADGKTRLQVVPKLNDNGTYDVEILRESDGEKTAIIRGLRVRSAKDSESNQLLEDQILEGAAQAMGVVGVSDLTDNMPLLVSIGKTIFVGGEINAGEGIDYTVVAEKSGKRDIEGSALIYSEGRLIGEVNSIKAALVRKDTIYRLLK